MLISSSICRPGAPNLRSGGACPAKMKSLKSLELSMAFVPLFELEEQTGRLRGTFFHLSFGFQNPAGYPDRCPLQRLF